MRSFITILRSEEPAYPPFKGTAPSLTATPRERRFSEGASARLIRHGFFAKALSNGIEMWLIPIGPASGATDQALVGSWGRPGAGCGRPNRLRQALSPKANTPAA